MKVSFSVGQWLAVLVALGALAGCASSQLQPVALPAQARITRSQAAQTALAQAPRGVIKDAELENDDGNLIWSFDIATPGSKTLTEINVDAVTGYVVSIATETPEDH